MLLLQAPKYCKAGPLVDRNAHGADDAPTPSVVSTQQYREFVCRLPSEITWIFGGRSPIELLVIDHGATEGTADELSGLAPNERTEKERYTVGRKLCL
jgi:hypothetical protein